MSMKHSVSWWCFEEKMKPQEFISAIKDTGYDGIDLVPREYWEPVHAAGLEVASVEAHRSIEDGLNKPENHDRIEGEILESIELAPPHGHASRAAATDTGGSDANGTCAGRQKALCQVTSTVTFVGLVTMS